MNKYIISFFVVNLFVYTQIGFCARAPLEKKEWFLKEQWLSEPIVPLAHREPVTQYEWYAIKKGMGDNQYLDALLYDPTPCPNNLFNNYKEYFKRSKRTKTPTQQAIIFKEFKQKFIKNSINPNSISKASDETPLISTMIRNGKSIPYILFLIRKGANVNLADQCGLRPLDYALHTVVCGYQDKKLLQLLCDHGAQFGPNKSILGNIIPLEAIYSSEQLELFRVLKRQCTIIEEEKEY